MFKSLNALFSDLREFFHVNDSLKPISNEMKGQRQVCIKDDAVSFSKNELGGLNRWAKEQWTFFASVFHYSKP
jgi:hypothetical protein